VSSFGCSVSLSEALVSEIGSFATGVSAGLSADFFVNFMMPMVVAVSCSSPVKEAQLV
jgi:hypothetical protein